MHILHKNIDQDIPYLLFPLYRLIQYICQFVYHKETILNSYLTLGPLRAMHSALAQGIVIIKNPKLDWWTGTLIDLKEPLLEINILRISQGTSWEEMPVGCFWPQSDTTSQ